MNKVLKSYNSIIWLLGGITAGSIAGLVFGKQAAIVKPIGDIFLNLLFVAVIPLVFSPFHQPSPIYKGLRS